MRSSTPVRRALARLVLGASLTAVLGGAPGLSSAQPANPPAEPATAKRELSLAAKLRCLVCQNQSLAESNADLAQDLRRQIGEQIRAGRSDDQILQFMVDRYGDFVLYQPPFKASTVLLWAGPFVLLLAAGVVLLRQLRGRGTATAEPPLTAEEQERASALLGDEPRSRAP